MSGDNQRRKGRRVNRSVEAVPAYEVIYRVAADADEPPSIIAKPSTTFVRVYAINPQRGEILS